MRNKPEVLEKFKKLEASATSKSNKKFRILCEQIDLYILEAEYIILYLASTHCFHSRCCMCMAQTVRLQFSDLKVALDEPTL